MAWMKPSPSLPSRASWPTWQSSKTSEAVSEMRMPTLSSCLPTETPGVSRGTRKAEMPRWSDPGFVRAMATATPPTDAWVMKFLEPLRIQPLSFRTAVVFVPPASEPASASVRPQAPRIFPLARRGTQTLRTSSEP